MKQHIRYWVDAALDANWRDHTPGASGPGNEQTGPVRSSRALGMILVAMHDAFAAGHPGMTPYVVNLAAPGGLDPAAAMAAAGYRVMGALCPGQIASLADTWDYYAKDTMPAAASVAFGAAVGDAVLAWRAGDGPFLVDGPALAPGAPPRPDYEHDSDPLHAPQPRLGENWGGAPPFLAAQQPFAVPPKPGGTPAAAAFYKREFDEVLAHGRETSFVRTPDQEEIGIYWGYDGPRGLGTPPRLYMQVAMTILDEIAARPGTWLNRRRYLEALTAIAVAMADSGIQAWHYKYSPLHMLWRPVLAIRRAPAAHGNVAVPTWRPLGAPQTNQTDLTRLATTPPFPAYPSGHATFGAASFEILRRFIRHHDPAVTFTDDQEDAIAFTFVSDEFDGRNADLRTGKPRPRSARHYKSLWDAIVDNSESRIWLGVHWRFDGISKQVGGGAPQHGRPANPGELGPYGGVRLGMDIAKDVASQRGFA